jgi:hypothetical protein
MRTVGLLGSESRQALRQVVGDEQMNGETKMSVSKKK